MNDKTSLYANCYNTLTIFSTFLYFQANGELKLEEHTNWLFPNTSEPRIGNGTNLNHPCKTIYIKFFFQTICFTIDRKSYSNMILDVCYII